MSALDRLAQNYELIPEILEEYEDLISEEVVSAKLQIKGKLLEVANTEQASHQYYYGVRKAELYSVCKWLEGKLAAIRGRHFKLFTENYSRELTDRQKDKYIDNEKEVLDQLQIYLTFKELYEKYETVCDAFRSRGFALRNITEIRIRSLEDTTI